MTDRRLCRRSLHDLDDPDNVYVQPSNGGRQCKPCMSERRKRNRAARLTQYAATEKAYRLANKARIAAYRRNSPAKVAEWNRTYRLANAEKFRGYGRKRRALLAGVPSEPYTKQDIVDRDGTDCGLCHEPIDLTVAYPDRWCSTIDHVVPITKGGHDVFANVQLAHMVCNSRKYNRET